MRASRTLPAGLLALALPAVATPLHAQADRIESPAGPARPAAPTPSSPYLPPGTPPPGLELPERAGDDQYWRHTVELIPELGVAWPRCREGDVSSRNCGGVQVGAHAGFTALWRVLPFFAWGGTLGVAAFQYDPPSSYGRSNTSAASVTLILVARAYLLEEGSIDPYLQLGLGGGALGTAFDETSDGTTTRYEETGAGPAVQIGAGLDFYLGRRLRLGPAVTLTQVTVDKVRRCTGSGEGDCMDLRKENDGYLDAYVFVSARLTICLGEEL